jgi:acyl-CoA synthetase (NDP forming)
VATAPFRDLSPLLNPRSIAVVGASEKPGSAGRLVLENLKQLNYPGKVYAVNPGQESVMGFPCFADLRSLPEPVEMAAVLLGADKVLPALKAGVGNGLKAAWVLASGFAEAGPEGQARQAELARFAAETGCLVCGPNCVGVFNLPDRFAAYSVALSPATGAGCVSAVLQSGAIAMGLANSARIGFRYLISSGNEAVLDCADYLGYLVNDPGTKVLVAFVEGIRHSEAFIAAAQAASQAGKPILLIKVGKSETARRTVQAHTGSLAGSDAVLDEVFRRYGVVRLDSLDELTEAIELFLTCPLPQSDGVGLLSLSGGQIGLIADLAQGSSLRFPPFTEAGCAALSQVLPPYSPIANPLDAWGSGDLERTYPECVAMVAREPQISLVAAARDTSPAVAQREVDQSLQVARALIKARRETGKPVVMFSNVSTGFQKDVHELLEAGGVPYLQGTTETLQALQAFENYAAYRRNLEKMEPVGTNSPASLTRWKARLQGMKGALSEVEGRLLLADYGIRGPREQVAGNETEACLAAERIGFPVVLKIISPDIRHKTEVGGVKVGLENQEMVARAFGEVVKSARSHRPHAKLEGVIVQEMIPASAVEVIVGILRDREFGPVLVYGSGGVLVELIRDSVLRLPPLSRAEALRMIEVTRGVKLLRGFRGSLPADVDALATAVVAISQLAVDLADHIAALDINPLMVLPEGQGVCAVDVLVEISST